MSTDNKETIIAKLNEFIQKQSETNTSLLIDLKSLREEFETLSKIVKTLSTPKKRATKAPATDINSITDTSLPDSKVVETKEKPKKKKSMNIDVYFSKNIEKFGEEINKHDNLKTLYSERDVASNKKKIYRIVKENTAYSTLYQQIVAEHKKFKAALAVTVDDPSAEPTLPEPTSLKVKKTRAKAASKTTKGAKASKGANAVNVDEAVQDLDNALE